jgi:hypothetical protein
MVNLFFSTFLLFRLGSFPFWPITAWPMPHLLINFSAHFCPSPFVSSPISCLAHLRLGPCSAWPLSTLPRFCLSPVLPRSMSFLVNFYSFELRPITASAPFIILPISALAYFLPRPQYLSPFLNSQLLPRPRLPT